MEKHQEGKTSYHGTWVHINKFDESKGLDELRFQKSLSVTIIGLGK